MKLKIRPEVEDFKYWVHLIVIVIIVYGLVNLFVEPMDISLKNIGLGVLFLGVADIFTHTILGLD